MKNTLGVLFGLIFLISPVAAQAQVSTTTSDTQDQKATLIAALQQLVAILTQRLSELLAQQSQVLSQQSQILNQQQGIINSLATQGTSANLGVMTEAVTEPVEDKSAISTSYNLDPNFGPGVQNAFFKIVVLDPSGRNIERPDVTITSTFNGKPFDGSETINPTVKATEKTLDPKYPWWGTTHNAGQDNWEQHFGPILTKKGTYNFTFTSGDLSTSTEIVI